MTAKIKIEGISSHLIFGHCLNTRVVPSLLTHQLSYPSEDIHDWDTRHVHVHMSVKDPDTML
jgi:hypothetical protein